MPKIKTSARKESGTKLDSIRNMFMTMAKGKLPALLAGGILAVIAVWMFCLLSRMNMVPGKYLALAAMGAAVLIAGAVGK